MTVDSSTTVEDVVVDPAQAADATAASSSSATDETEVDTLSVVRDVVEQRETVETAAAPSAEGVEEVGEAADGQAPKAEQDDYSDVPFNQHPRFQQVIRERTEFKADSDEYRKITSFLDSNGLTPKEASDGIEIMALMKLDPAAAWKRLQPLVKNVLIAAGEVLPDDLDKQVKDGKLTRDGALEVSRARASLATQKARETFNAERGQRQQQTAASTAVVDAVAEWENDRSLKDPQFKAKLPRLQEKIAFLHATEGRPKDAAGAKAQLKKAYDAVNKELPKVVDPTPKPVRKPAITPVRGGQVATNAQTQQPSSKAKTTLDIVREGIQRQSA
jgi:hypothetical protein